LYPFLLLLIDLAIIFSRIKGRSFTIGGLLKSDEEAKRFAGGALAIFRLAPQDYHRFHIPVNGVIQSRAEIAGHYFTVNPMAIRSQIDVYLENKRTVTFIESPEFGRVAYVAVGAMMVGCINHTTKVGQSVERLQEEGYFAFGGSTVILVFEPNKIQWDADLLANSERKIETLVRVGSSLGKRVSSP
jgi:phosphatidylserine decarboxylase